jgi:tRNA(Ile)-lysidine synthase
LINLMRGSGIDGLAGIPPLRRMGKGWVARPLLDFRRHELESFLRGRQIVWMDDPSNRNSSFDRNFFRNNIIPELEKRWPEAVPGINQTARHARQFASTFTNLLLKQYGNLLRDEITLPLPPLLCLELDLQAALIRHWIRDQDIMTPPRRRLHEFLQQLNAPKGQGLVAELRWAGWILKRHGGVLWLHATPAPAVCPDRSWDTGTTLDLGVEFGEVLLVGGSTVPRDWRLGPRRKGAGMQLHKNGHRQALKELLRLSGIPPWLRDCVPVLYWQEDVAAVGDWLIGPRLRHFLDAEGATYLWNPIHPLLRKLQSVSVHFLQHTDYSNGQVFGTTT